MWTECHDDVMLSTMIYVGASWVIIYKARCKVRGKVAS